MIAIWIVIIIIFLAALYTLASELVFHLWHVGTLWHGPRDVRAVALTFDDGPDEKYTPQVLDILREANVKASFFLVGKRAVAHPDLVKSIADAGHEICTHAYAHRHAWIRTPWGTARDLARAKDTLESLTGRPVRYHRPPWGAFNPFLRLACRKLGLTPVLWDTRGMDWEAKQTPVSIRRNVLRSVQPGSIVLLHDAGGSLGAPQRTITALPAIIQTLRDLGFTFTTVDDLATRQRTAAEQHRLRFRGYSLPRRALIGIWGLVEWYFARRYRVLTLDAMYRVSRTVWHHGSRMVQGDGPDNGATEGSSTTTGDLADPNATKGPVLRDGLPAADLHFQNDTLLAISAAEDNRALVRGLRLAKGGLQNVARVFQHHPDYEDVQVAMAITLMNRGIEMLGFHVEELPDSLSKRWFQFYMRFLMGLYHPEGFRRLRYGSQKPTLKLVWMTRDEVIGRYGLGSAGKSGSNPASVSEASGESRPTAETKAT